MTHFDVFHDNAPVAAQVIKESANLKIDWVKRVVFDTELPPGQMCRFRLQPRIEPSACEYEALTGNTYTFTNESVCVLINLQTGLIDRFMSGGRELLHENACALLVYQDNDDPWAMSKEQYYEVGQYTGAFTLMSANDSARFAGDSSERLHPVRIIEDGPVLVRLEASFAFGDSTALTQYTFYRNHAYFDVCIRLDNREKKAVIRLALPSIQQGS